jgi:hypothetical protein
MTPEIGDKFIIDWYNHELKYPGLIHCKFPNMEFTITKFSKSGISVYFEDRRTNKKCKCTICKSVNIVKCVAVYNIIITKKRLQVEREAKLKQLGLE